MAVAQSPNSKARVSAQVEKKNKRKMLNSNAEEEKTESPRKSDDVSSQPRKRNKCPGVRVVHGRIYDSENGKTCHQCRQKTLDFSADCKNQVRNKQCTLKYCRTCLLNRYGEKAEDVTSLEDWKCPRCRDICNCSICMKKRGHQPTGMLTQTAKAGGFSSVSDLIQVKGAQNVCNYKSPKQMGASPRKQAPPLEGLKIASPVKLGKENVFDGKIDSNANPLTLVPSPVEEKPKQKKRKGPEVMHSGSGVKNVSLNETSLATSKNQKKVKPQGLETENSKVLPEETSHSDKKKSKKTKVLPEETSHSDKKKSKKMKVEKSKEVIVGDVDSGANLKVTSPAKPHVSKGILKQDKANKKASNVLQDKGALKDEKDVAENKKRVHEDAKGLDSGSDQKTNQQLKDKKYGKGKENVSHLNIQPCEAVVPLPTGSELVTVAGVDLPKEDAGNALQFLEFCATFGKILDVKKGQAEVVLRELIKGRSTRRGKYSVIIQFQIQLLSIIQEDLGSESPTLDPTHGNDSWLKALKSCIPRSKDLLEHLDKIDKDAGGYHDLDASMKLRLLNFLCDEVLGTEKIRNWIDDQNTKFAEKRKEAREVFASARDKEKSFKQQMQDDIAKAVIAKKGVPLTIPEHEALVSKIKNKVAEAHAEMLECKRMVPMDKYKPDAVRTEPVYRDNNGHVYWRLKGYSDKSDILQQDIGTGDDRVESSDKWFYFDSEQTSVIEKHITALRNGRKRPQS